MPRLPRSLNLTLLINTGAEDDTEELDRLTRQLRTELQELDVETVELVKGVDAPEGAKSGEPVVLGALAVVVLPAVVPKLIALLQSWAARGENRTVQVTAKIGDQLLEPEIFETMSLEELKRLVNTLV